MLAFRRVVQVLVVVVKRLVVIVDARQVRVSEDFTQQHRAVTHARLQLAVDFTDPAALPLLLVFPVGREAGARLAFHVVEPGIRLHGSLAIDRLTQRIYNTSQQRIARRNLNYMSCCPDLITLTDAARTKQYSTYVVLLQIQHHADL